MQETCSRMCVRLFNEAFDTAYPLDTLTFENSKYLDDYEQSYSESFIRASLQYLAEAHGDPSDYQFQYMKPNNLFNRLNFDDRMQERFRALGGKKKKAKEVATEDALEVCVEVIDDCLNTKYYAALFEGDYDEEFPGEAYHALTHYNVAVGEPAETLRAVIRNHQKKFEINDVSDYLVWLFGPRRSGVSNFEAAAKSLQDTDESFVW